MTTAPVTFGGTVAVYCVHDRRKRSVADLEFDAARTKAHACACCENLFLDRTDTPVLCPTCSRLPEEAR